MDTGLVWWLEELRSEVEGSISTPSIIMLTITNNINIGCLKEKKRNQNIQNHNFFIIGKYAKLSILFIQKYIINKN
jgi:hypothetical protein